MAGSWREPPFIPESHAGICCRREVTRKPAHGVASGAIAPDYSLVTTASGRLSAAEKQQIASAISRVHNEVTHAPLFFAQIIFHEIAAGNQFIAGRAVSPDMVFIHGYIRAGRTPTQKRALLAGIVDAAIAATTLPRGSVWAYLSELPPGQMVEYGHFLPEPGMENVWLAGLPDAERAHIARVGE